MKICEARCESVESLRNLIASLIFMQPTSFSQNQSVFVLTMASLPVAAVSHIYIYYLTVKEVKERRMGYSGRELLADMRVNSKVGSASDYID